MSTMLRSFVRLDHVDQPSICGHGESVGEAVNSIAYCHNGKTLSILELVDRCERFNIDLEIVVLNGDKPFIVKAGDIPKICAN